MAPHMSPLAPSRFIRIASSGSTVSNDAGSVVSSTRSQSESGYLTWLISHSIVSPIYKHIESHQEKVLKSHGFIAETLPMGTLGNVTLHHFRGDASEGVCLVLGGLASKSPDHGEFLSKLTKPRGLDKRLSVVAMDLPGHGATTVRITPENIEECTEKALRYVQSQYPGRPIFLAGHSLGGFVATQLAVRTKMPLAGVALFCPAGAQIAYQDHCDFTHNLINAFEKPVERPSFLSFSSWRLYFQRLFIQERWFENPDFTSFLTGGTDPVVYKEQFTTPDDLNKILSKTPRVAVYWVEQDPVITMERHSGIYRDKGLIKQVASGNVHLCLVSEPQKCSDFVHREICQYQGPSSK